MQLATARMASAVAGSASNHALSHGCFYRRVLVLVYSRQRELERHAPQNTGYSIDQLAYNPFRGCRGQRAAAWVRCFGVRVHALGVKAVHR